VNDYVSADSQNGCRYQEFLYLLENQQITESEYNVFVFGDEPPTIIEDDELGGVGMPNRMMKAGLNGIQAYGKITWEDHYGRVHNARCLEVQVLDRSANWGLSPNVLTTIYTDENGDFDVTLHAPNNYYFLSIRIYLRNQDFSIKYGWFMTFDYNFESDVVLASCSGESINFDYLINYDAQSDRNKAMSIHQALTWGFDYMDMIGAQKDYLDLWYPAQLSYYAYNVIHIDGSSDYPNDDSYNWDTVLHEFGHFIADKEKFSYYCAGDHGFADNLVDRHNNKLFGTKMAWSEGLATYFAQIIKLKTGLADLNPEVGGVSPGLCHGLSIDIDSQYLLGEANEWVIARLLWDFQDDDYWWEPIDSVHWGHVSLFNKLRYTVAINAGARITNLSLFIETQDISITDEAIGDLLSYYDIASRLIGPDDDLLSTNSRPIFSWEVGGGSVNHPNNYFTLNIFKMTGEMILVKQLGNLTQYQLTALEWSRILNINFVTHVQWNVMAEQRDASLDNYDTGPYISQTFTLRLPNRVTRIVDRL